MAVGSARDLCLSRIVDELSPGHALLALADYAFLGELMRECSAFQIEQVVRCAEHPGAPNVTGVRSRSVILSFLPPPTSRTAHLNH